MKIAIVINKERLTDELKQKLTSNELRDKYQLDYDVFYPAPQEIETVLEKIKTQNYQVHVIGGGDGTVRQAVQILMNTDAAFAILPLGTFNALAKDLNYPDDIDKLFEIIKNYKTKLIDLTLVNELISINHIWLGIYFHILKSREKHKHFFGRSKVLKALFNLTSVFKKLPLFTLEMEAEGKHISYKTYLVFVGNNEFYTSLFDLGDRKILSSGLMSVTILNAHTRWQLFLSMLHLIFGQVKNSKYITYFHTNKMTITTKRDYVNVVIDGETFKLTSPLYFSTE